MRTVIETASLVRRGEMKASEALDETLAAVERHNGELNAFIHLDGERARVSADRVDQAVARGEDPGPLAGVPFGVKDLDDCEGMPTTKGSLWFKGSAPAVADAIHVARFRAAGAVPVGKTAVPEFGTWAYTATRAWVSRATRGTRAARPAARAEVRQRGRRGHGAVRDRERRRRVDAHAGGLLRPRRAQAVVRPHPRCRRRVPSLSSAS